MNILVINSGSSSIKYKLFKNNIEIKSGLKENVISYKTALIEILNNEIDIKNLDGVGHRVVHGGELFSKPTLINKTVIKQIKKLIPLAPLHNKINLEAIEIIYKIYKKLPQVAVFDTAYHQTIPKKSYTYPLPIEYYKKYHIRKYGFHGTSIEYVSKITSKYLNKKLSKSNFIVLHLGNGASITAIKNGKSYDTSMGFTPLDGLMMGTRSGAIDPAIITYLEKYQNKSIQEIDNILNKKSGFLGLCKTNDLREVLKNIDNGDINSKLAFDIYIKKIKEYLSSYIILLKKVDAIIFTGGIGENSSIVRKSIIKDFDILGVKLHKNKNNNINKEICNINSDKSRIKLIVAKTNEEKNISLNTSLLLSKKSI